MVTWLGEGLRVLLPGGPQRRLPQVPLPTTAFLPGERPHPRHAAPDAFADAVASLPAWTPGAPEEQARYALALDLLEAGFPWEAHELLEQGWLVNGRHGPTAIQLQRLIWAAASRIARHRGHAAAAERLEARSRG